MGLSLKIFIKRLGLLWKENEKLLIIYIDKLSKWETKPKKNCCDFKKTVEVEVRCLGLWSFGKNFIARLAPGFIACDLSYSKYTFN